MIHQLHVTPSLITSRALLHARPPVSPAPQSPAPPVTLSLFPTVKSLFWFASLSVKILLFKYHAHEENVNSPSFLPQQDPIPPHPQLVPCQPGLVASLARQQFPFYFHRCITPNWKPEHPWHRCSVTGWLCSPNS